ncbi:pyridine nucleotide-disulfide oxidoreductase [Streptomyces sp. NRRL F-4489]|uniref:NAD(P)/FAD-dependent oxidoreductase n=1 Tax=Streptomyces sp. NRRL F-4489 TaxID=1609095 RepID=UPI0007467BC9|nr:FAD-dependent oxidoreductase [Streptomyces sp. NRRL F-4489]KUL53974.1 pyridine nucleotide-disulfide oxidoreductase [Streptomyces sp. NRRL F-4489]
MREVVVVGAGLAGVRAGESLRARGFDGALTVVSDEAELPYDRPPLTKQVVAGTLAEADIRLAGAEDFGARWIRGTAAAGLDRARRRVRLADGTEVPYDGLVVATGAQARAWPGEVPAGVLTVRGLADVRALRAAVDGGAREVVIVGAGFVGVELASSLAGLGLGVRVTLVEPFGRPLRALGGSVPDVVAAAARRAGVGLRLGTAVTGFRTAGERGGERGAGRVGAVVLADGSELPAELVVVAIGMVPATGWLAGAGLALPGGRVHCDARLFARTAEADGTAGAADPRIVVAGDVAWCDAVRSADGPVPLEHWSNAAAQGELAAANLLAGPAAAEAYDHMPSFWTSAFGLRIKSVGLPGTGDRVVAEEGEPGSEKVVEAHYRADRLVGAVSVNLGKRLAGYARRLQEEGDRADGERAESGAS